MFDVRLAGGHLYGKQLFTWLSPLDVLDGIWDLIESVSEGFLTYFCFKKKKIMHAVDRQGRHRLSIAYIIFLASTCWRFIRLLEYLDVGR